MISFRTFPIVGVIYMVF